MAGANGIAAQIVGGAQGRHRRVVLPGDLRDRFTVLHLVALPAHALACRDLVQRRRELVGDIDRHHQPVRTRGSVDQRL